jgi:hypothetical protein
VIDHRPRSLGNRPVPAPTRRRTADRRRRPTLDALERRALLAHLTLTWNGGATGAWADPANWTPSQIPTIDDNVLIETPNARVIASDPIAVRNIEMPAAGSYLQLAGGTITGIITGSDTAQVFFGGNASTTYAPIGDIGIGQLVVTQLPFATTPAYTLTVTGQVNITNFTVVTGGTKLVLNGPVVSLSDDLGVYNGASLTMAQAPADGQLTTLTIDNGTLDAPGDWTLVGTSSRFAQGVIRGLDSLTVRAGARLAIGDGGNTQKVVGARLATEAATSDATAGELVVAGDSRGGGLVLEAGASIDNAGIVRFPVDTRNEPTKGSRITGGAGGSFLNRGALSLQVGATSTSVIDVPFSQTAGGTTSIANGTLILGGSGAGGIQGSLSAPGGQLFLGDGGRPGQVGYDIDAAIHARQFVVSGVFSPSGVRVGGSLSVTDWTDVTMDSKVQLDATVASFGSRLRVLNRALLEITSNLDDFALNELVIEHGTLAATGTLRLTGPDSSFNIGSIRGLGQLTVAPGATLTLGSPDEPALEPLGLDVPVQVGGTLRLRPGRFAGPGTITIEPAGVLNVSAGPTTRANALIKLDGLTIINRSPSAAWDGVAVGLYENSAFINKAGATFTATAPLAGAYVSFNGIGALGAGRPSDDGHFINEAGATFVKAGPGNAQMGVAFQNLGTVRIDSGTLDLGYYANRTDSAVLSTGEFTGAANTRLNILNVGQTLSGTVNVPTLWFTTGTHTISGTTTVTNLIGAVCQLSITGTANATNAFFAGSINTRARPVISGTLNASAVTFDRADALIEGTYAVGSTTHLPSSTLTTTRALLPVFLATLGTGSVGAITVPVNSYDELRAQLDEIDTGAAFPANANPSRPILIRIDLAPGEYANRHPDTQEILRLPVLAPDRWAPFSETPDPAKYRNYPIRLTCTTLNSTATILDVDSAGGVSFAGSEEVQGNVVIEGFSPALVVLSGVTTLGANVRVTTTTDSPTIIVSRGVLSATRATIEQTSATSTQPAILIQGGTAILGSPASPGNNTITVAGSGGLLVNETFNPITAHGNTYVVGGVALPPTSALSTTSVGSDRNPSTLGQSVTLRAFVRRAGGVPTGSVQFIDQTSGVTLGTAPLADGVATLTTSSLPAGDRAILVRYSGDAETTPTARTSIQSVRYAFSGFAAPLGTGIDFALGRSIPIKFTLTNAAGAAITEPSAVTALAVAPVSASGVVGAPIPPASADGAPIRYVASSRQFVFNWNTRGLTAGAYQVQLLLADGTLQTRTVQLRAGGGSLGLVSAGGGTGQTTDGGLLGGDVVVAIDPDGAMSPEMRARVEDAIARINATLEPYGVRILAADPNLGSAEVLLGLAPTSAVGSAADGVLGCKDEHGHVTILAGWDWYVGADPAGVAPGQFDFQTVVAHELGHVLGLGHSADPASVMHDSLAPGTTRRLLVAADLNLPDDDAGGPARRAASRLDPLPARARGGRRPHPRDAARRRVQAADPAAPCHASFGSAKPDSPPRRLSGKALRRRRPCPPSTTTRSSSSSAPEPATCRRAAACSTSIATTSSSSPAR